MKWKVKRRLIDCLRALNKYKCNKKKKIKPLKSVIVPKKCHGTFKHNVY